MLSNIYVEIAAALPVNSFSVFPAFFQLRSQVPEGMCVCVPCGKIREQMSSLMKYFNVKVKARDIFSRCQVVT